MKLKYNEIHYIFENLADENITDILGRDDLDNFIYNFGIAKLFKLAFINNMLDKKIVKNYLKSIDK